MKRAIPPVLFAFSLFVNVWIGGCAPVSAPEAAPSLQQQVETPPQTIPELENLAGFDVLEPAYLPAGVSLDSVSFEQTPSLAAVLHFKLVHEQYGDRGPFFFIRQEPQTEPSPAPLSCGEEAGCELLQVGDVPVLYHLSASPDGAGIFTEGLEWYAGGFAFRLHRMAGEPNKVYKEELLKVVKSMK